MCFCAHASAGSFLLDWGSGWQFADPDGSYQDGALTNFTSVGGVDIEVRVSFNGSATGVNNFAGPDGFSPTPFTDEAFFNGDQADSDPALGISDSVSKNDNGVFENFVRVSIMFSQAVELHDFAVGDVDISGGGSWQDAFAVVGSLDDQSFEATYDPSSTAFFEVRSANLANAPFQNAVFGTANAANDSDDAQFNVSLDGPVDLVDLYYWNGPDSSGQEGRSIYIQDISFVPTPGAAALALIGAATGVRRRR